MTVGIVYVVVGCLTVHFVEIFMQIWLMLPTDTWYMILFLALTVLPDLWVAITFFLTWFIYLPPLDSDPLKIFGSFLFRCVCHVCIEEVRGSWFNHKELEHSFYSVAPRAKTQTVGLSCRCLSIKWSQHPGNNLWHKSFNYYKNPVWL